ncbi:DUF257 family protein [Thermococcus peptonophilus]|uniref:KaiC-like domain-containing protein n=1 Tax=Thermococcus peptonophilus TaxID=53952 RepID=A0A142CWC7_9EURY|nr:DUF257 family protein [Thermococcus peptonophilus]AMQ19079.1 hypothetical protein A0127_07830 [Thermococcus peptonophilus]
MDKEVREFEKILDGIKFGESVMVEYSGYSVPAEGLYHLVKWAKEKGHKVVIVDILDTLYLYYQHIKLYGKDAEILNDVTVVKIGGRFKVGNVAGRINITGPTIGERAFSEVYQDIVNDGNVVTIVLGLAKLMMLYADSKKDILNIVNIILSYIGDEKVKGFHFINRDLMKEVSPYIIPLIAELMTTVIKIERVDGVSMMRVVRSLNPNIEKLELKLS